MHFLFRQRPSHPNLTWFSVARYHGVTLASDRRAPSLGAQGLCNSCIPHPIVDFINFSPYPYICAFTRKIRLRLRSPETWMCQLLSVYKLKARLTGEPVHYYYLHQLSTATQLGNVLLHGSMFGSQIRRLFAEEPTPAVTWSCHANARAEPRR